MGTGVPGQVFGVTNVRALIKVLEQILKPAAFQDITFADIVGADVDSNGNLMVSVLVDGTTIGGDGKTVPLFVINPVLGKGSQAIPAGAYSQAVVLPSPIAHSALLALPSWNTTIYYIADAPAGFTFGFGTQCPLGGGTVFWLIA